MEKSYSFDEYKNMDEIKKISQIIEESEETLEGNCLYLNKSREYNMEKEDLRYNLFNLCKNANNILEVGFNAGHSTLLYFYSNPNISVTSFDICYHRYTQYCANYIKNLKYNFRLIKGNSLLTLKQFNIKNNHKIDLIHIDGGHDIRIAKNDIINCKKFASDKTLLIIDDTNNISINSLIEKYINENYLKEVDYQELGLKNNNFHKILRYI